MTNRSRVLRDTRGQALVEFALLLPLVMLILIGIVEFGRAWQAKQTLTDVAREGARLSVIGDPNTYKSDVDLAVRTAIVVAGFDSSTASGFLVEWPEGCRWIGCSPLLGTNDPVAVKLTLPYQFVALHRLTQLLTDGNGTMMLRTTARMRIE